MNRATVTLLVATVIMAAVGIVLGDRALNEPMKLPTEGYVLDVPAGTSLRALAARLGREGILNYPALLVIYGRVTGEASQIKAGEYEIATGTTARGLLRQLIDGQVMLHSLTVIEGWTFRDLLAAIRKNPAVRQTLPKGDSHITTALGMETSRPEGWFFPDTYRFPRNVTDVELLAMSHSRMQIVLERAWAGRSVDLPLHSAYDALILASIVEKETALDRERPRVAGVLIRRLKAGMRLQADPTVIYGLGDEYDGDITRRQLSRDTPYNTYTRTGLPPSPICLPGESSILAAVHPDSSDALYFVASGDGDGSHVLSATLREHNAAVKRYQDSLRVSGK